MPFFRNIRACIAFCAAFALFFQAIFAPFSPVGAADSPWSAWLYNPQTGGLLHVDSDGLVLETAALTLPADFTIYPDNVAVSHAGQLVAYVLVAEDFSARRLLILDLGSGATLTEYPLPAPAMGPLNGDDRLDLTSNYLIYSPDDSALAFSYRLAGEGWRIVVLDVHGGELFALASGDPVLASHVDLGGGALPHVRQVMGGFVSFTLDAPPGSPAPFLKNFTWDTRTGIVREDVAYPTFDTATLHPSGEVVMPLVDFRFPAENADLPWQRNTLQVYEPVSGERFPFFSSATLDFSSVHFVQGGERVLASGEDVDGHVTWLVLDRDGTVVYRLPNADRRDITGVPDGFIFLTDFQDRVVLVFTDTRDFDAGKTVWLDARPGWRIVWTPPPTDALNVRPWAQLADPVTAPFTIPADVLAAATLTPFPTPGPVLYPGLAAQVQTDDGGYLNLRATPTTDGEVLALLEDRTLITLLEGPRAAEGYVWWRVRVAHREGWVVESVGDLQTVIPCCKPPPEETTPEASPVR